MKVFIETLYFQIVGEASTIIYFCVCLTISIIKTFKFFNLIKRVREK